MSGGIKHDSGTEKNPWHLAPWDAFRAIVRVMAFGAKKYAPRNWELGIEYGRVYRAAIEHLSKWWMREDEGKGPGVDPETGYSHLWHAGCCVCFMIAYEIRGVPNLDDRPTLLPTADPPKYLDTFEGRLCPTCINERRAARARGADRMPICPACVIENAKRADAERMAQEEKKIGAIG